MTKQDFIDSVVVSLVGNLGSLDASPDELWSYAEALWNARPRNKAVKKERQAIAKFQRPTPNEVDAYIKEMGYTMFDGSKFCDFYSAKGWKIGNTPMKDWKAAVRTWGKKEQERKAETSKPIRRRL